MSDYSPEEAARHHAALEAGIRGALERKSGLVLVETWVEGTRMWMAVYPPAGLNLTLAAGWVADHGLRLSQVDRYLPLSEVERAARDLKIDGK